jgi:hypothetical protein
MRLKNEQLSENVDLNKELASTMNLISKTNYFDL